MSWRENWSIECIWKHYKPSPHEQTSSHSNEEKNVTKALRQQPKYSLAHDLARLVYVAPI